MNESNLIATVTGDVYRAAFECMSKDDARYYLNGLHLSVEHAELVGTNGHIMYYGPVELADSDSKDLIFEAPKLLLNVAEVRIMTTDEPRRVRLEAVTKRGDVNIHLCKLIDGRYPDYRSVAAKKPKKTPFNDFGFNANYLAALPKIFGKNAGLKFEMSDSNSAAHIKNVQGGNKLPGTLIMMPVRIS